MIPLKLLGQTIAVAFAMFSALPMPQFGWNEKNMRYALCAFPLIGVVIGALWSLCGALPLPDAVHTMGYCLIPVAVTGGIHLDGYADTSRRPFQLWRPRKKARNFEGPPLRCLRGHPPVQLLCGLPVPVRLHPLHAPGGPVLDIGPCAGALPFRLCGGFVPYGQKHGPCPHLRHGGRSGAGQKHPAGRQRGPARPCSPIGAGWRWPPPPLGCWCTTVLWPNTNSAASRATWPAGFCSGPSCGCWPPSRPASGGGVL